MRELSKKTENLKYHLSSITPFCIQNFRTPKQGGREKIIFQQSFNTGGAARISILLFPRGKSKSHSALYLTKHRILLQDSRHRTPSSPLTINPTGWMTAKMANSTAHVRHLTFNENAHRCFKYAYFSILKSIWNR